MPTESPQPVNGFDAWMLQYGPLIFGGFQILLGVLGLGIGVWSLYEGLRGIAKVRSASRWPTTPGEVCDSAISYRPRGGEGGSIDEWAPYIRYKYTVGEQEYVSDKVIAASFESQVDPSYAKAWTDAYPLGLAVNVYYNPRQPGEAILVLEEKASTQTIGERVGCGVFGIVFGIYCFYTFFQSLNSPK